MRFLQTKILYAGAALAIIGATVPAPADAAWGGGFHGGFGHGASSGGFHGGGYRGAGLGGFHGGYGGGWHGGFGWHAGFRPGWGGWRGGYGWGGHVYGWRSGWGVGFAPAYYGGYPGYYSPAVYAPAYPVATGYAVPVHHAAYHHVVHHGCACTCCR